MDTGENSLIRPILNYPNYSITQSGRVWVKVRYGRDGYKAGGRWLKPFRSGNTGHLHVELCKNGIPKAVYVHQLVLEAFVGSCPEGMECRHLDGNPKNNELENLCWGTRKENQADRKRHGTSNCGERQGRVKLTECKVELIRLLHANK